MKPVLFIDQVTGSSPANIICREFILCVSLSHGERHVLKILISEVDIAGFIERENVLQQFGAHVVPDLSLFTLCRGIRCCLFSNAGQ